MSGSEDEEAAPEERGGSWRLAMGAFLLVVLLVSPLWGPVTLRHLEFFRVRRIEIIGARYTPPEELLRRLAVDTSRSVWDPAAPLERRAASHPQVERAVVTRRLPGTLVVALVERAPVGLRAVDGVLRAVDERGTALPLDPTRTPVDLPIVLAAPQDTMVYHLLAAMRRGIPALFARLSSVRRTGVDELLLQVADVSVRVGSGVTVARLADIEPVERHLARRNLRAAELDLRYRDQVIARLP